MSDNRGGARKGAGRKTKADETRIQEMAAKALILKYGSEEGAFGFLLDSGEPSLIKFAYEHAFGKPREKVSIDTPSAIRIIRDKDV